MTGTLSPDGKWLWNGSEWIPAPPPTTEEVLQQSAPVIDATAQQYNLDPQQLSANTQNFDLNQDNTISEYEAQLSAQSMLTPPQVAYPKPMLNQPSQSNNKKFLAIGITVLLIGSIAFWLLSPLFHLFLVFMIMMVMAMLILMINLMIIQPNGLIAMVMALVIIKNKEQLR